MSRDLDETIQYHKGMADEYENRAKCHSRPQPGVYGSGRSYLKLMERAREHRQLAEWLEELEMSRRHLNYMLCCLEKYDDDHCINEIYSELARYDSDMDEFRRIQDRV